MTDKEKTEKYGDPTTYEFWEAARRKELVIQHCGECGAYQFYPRPFCLQCGEMDLNWHPVSGKGIIYSMTEVQLPVSQLLEPPYVVALVELDEGPRMLGNIVDSAAEIGNRVKLVWQERDNAPPLPMWTAI